MKIFQMVMIALLFWFASTLTGLIAAPAAVALSFGFAVVAITWCLATIAVSSDRELYEAYAL